MPDTIETEGVLEIRDRVSLRTRVIFALLSLFPLLAPYELLILPKWEHRLHPFFLLCAFISIGAMTLSGLLVWAAIAGLNSRMRFDRPRRHPHLHVGCPDRSASEVRMSDPVHSGR